MIERTRSHIRAGFCPVCKRNLDIKTDRRYEGEVQEIECPCGQKFISILEFKKDK